jgi:ADP-dependent NAD(P)H-hydrate dehydratase / NAD(P)H-hydrate epimerase
MKLVTVAEMRAIEREADAQGITYSKMMETAGLGLAEVIQSLDLFEEDHHILGLVGSGNNGGDTLVALAALAEIGWHAVAYLVRSRDDQDPLLENLRATGGGIISTDADPDFENLDKELSEANLILDGVLGTGIKLPLNEDVARVLKRVQEYEPNPQVIAVDCPSGMDADTGEIASETIPADVTVCMGAVKAGMLKFPAFSYLGELELVGLGLPENLTTWTQIQSEVITPEWVSRVIPPRPLDAHKGTFGTAMIVAGSINFTGAAYLAGKAAYRIGTGLVRMAVPGPLHGILAGQIPEATWLILPHQMGVIGANASDVLLKNLEKVSAMLVGSGLGLEDTTEEFLRRILLGKQSHKSRSNFGFVGAEKAQEEQHMAELPPMVIDADGIKLLAKITDWQNGFQNTVVLTPHPGEMAILCGKPIDEIQQNRLLVAKSYAMEWKHVVVLKGAVTVVAAPDGRVGVIPIATPALAKAGTGDVLAGIITGLRAQGVPAYEAACAGVWIHGRAGLIAEEKVGHSASVLASDVLESIAEVLQEII